LLAALQQKKQVVVYGKDSRRYIYRPTASEKKAKRAALSHLLNTFFEGKSEILVASLLNPADQKLSDEEIRRIRQLFSQAIDP
jgi:predicted transcriptional regulator